MGYIPKDAKWYLAEIVQQILVEGDSRNVIHSNLVLVRADSPEEAYDRAIKLGAEGEASWENPEGKCVSIVFKGLHDLNVVHGELEHGTELICSENLDWDDAAIHEWVTAKEELGVFTPITPSTGPDYRSREVVDEVSKRFPDLDRDWGRTRS